MSADKIIIRTPNWLGDLMMSTAFINEVLSLFPDSQVDLVVKKGFENIPLPHRGIIFPFEKQSTSVFEFGKGLRQHTYDRFYVLPPSFSSALMARASRANKQIGYKGSLRGLLLNHGRSYSSKHRTQHLVVEYLQLLENWTAEREIQPGLKISKAWLDKTLSELRHLLPDSFVCIAPGAIYGPAKQWPVEHFKALTDILDGKGISAVIIGTKDEIQLGENLVNATTKALNLCGKTSLNQLIAILATSKALVSNDSGTMHIMAALQKPQVAIFGSTSTVWTSPVNKRADIIKLEIECSPCFKRVCPLGHTNCLKQISAGQVWRGLEAILK